MNTDSSILRLRLVGVAIVSLMAALVARLWFLQAVDNAELQAQALDNSFVTVIEPAARGRILDVNGQVLVRNRLVTVVVVDLQELDQVKPSDAARNEMLGRLAVELSRNGKLTKVADLQTALNSAGVRNYGKVIVSVDVPQDLFVFFGEKQDQFPGVHIEQTSVREYLYGSLAAHILGYVGRIDANELKRLNERWSIDDPTAKTYLPNEVIGKDGVEKMFEDDLRGTPGRRVYEVDRNQRVLREVTSERRDPIPGNDVFLSIDINIQGLVEAELQTGLETARNTPIISKNDPSRPDPPQPQAPAGAAVVLNPETGAIVAMASYPTYDPSDFVDGISKEKYALLNSRDAHFPFVNRAISGEYAPGSTFKLFTAYAAMTKGPKDSDFPMLSDRGIGGYLFPRDDPGYYQLPDDQCDEAKISEQAARAAGSPTTLSPDKVFTSCRFNNPDNRTHSELTIMKALAVSSDAYFYEIAANYDFREEFDRTFIQQQAAKFGFGRDTGTGLPNERPGTLPTPEWLKQKAASCKQCGLRNYWVLGDTVQLSVGQGLNLVTPLQLTNAYATFANGGSLLAPNIACKVSDASGKTVRKFNKRVLGNVDIAPDVRQPIVEGLEGVVALPGPEGDRGTAFEAFHYPNQGGVAFDLGTWRVAGKTGTAEVQGKADNAWFVAFNQDKERPYVVSALLEESGFGGSFAAPVVARILDHLLYNDVLPQPSKDDRARIAQERLAATNYATSSYGSVSAYKPSTTTTTAPPATTAPTASAGGKTAATTVPPTTAKVAPTTAPPATVAAAATVTQTVGPKGCAA